MITELDHPLVHHHLSILRDRTTTSSLFREKVRQLSIALAYEATAHLPKKSVIIDTPLVATECQQLADSLTLIPILRAGLGMSDSIQDLIPQSTVRHLGLYRDETTHQPVNYYQNFDNTPAPDIVFILDPMLATGGSANEAIRQVKEWGVKKISFLCLLAAPEGIKAVTTLHPDIDIFTCAIDDHLNENAYIIPGLGDAGDRIFNTPC